MEFDNIKTSPAKLKRNPEPRKYKNAICVKDIPKKTLFDEASMVGGRERNFAKKIPSETHTEPGVFGEVQKAKVVFSDETSFKKKGSRKPTANQPRARATQNRAPAKVYLWDQSYD